MKRPTSIELENMLLEILNELQIEYRLRGTLSKNVVLHCGPQNWGVQVGRKGKPDVGFVGKTAEVTINLTDKPSQIRAAVEHLLVETAPSSRVYVVQNVFKASADNSELVPKYDLSAASRYGKIIFLLGNRARPFDSQPIISEMRKKLQDITKADYILLIGNPCFIGYAVAIAAAKCDGFVNLLQWHGLKKEYVHIKAQLPVEEAL